MTRRKGLIAIAFCILVVAGIVVWPTLTGWPGAYETHAQAQEAQQDAPAAVPLGSLGGLGVTTVAAGGLALWGRRASNNRPRSSRE